MTDTLPAGRELDAQDIADEKAALNLCLARGGGAGWVLWRFGDRPAVFSYLRGSGPLAALKAVEAQHE